MNELVRMQKEKLLGKQGECGAVAQKNGRRAQVLYSNFLCKMTTTHRGTIERRTFTSRVWMGEQYSKKYYYYYHAHYYAYYMSG